MRRSRPISPSWRWASIPKTCARYSGRADLDVTRWGTIKADHKTLRTNLEGVYAAGDIVRGASLVVWAIRDGRDAAAAIHADLSARVPIDEAAE